ncbi:MAG TPA: Gfo/Idh/MocA family oxidoreductase [Mycobacteriales bacterium]|nr:Gfo/Idh/MocA family oxidoreductase [Mycobacteriales bacterium]
MGKLRLGIIGAGSWVVASHLPTLAARSDEIALAGVCRHGADRLERVRSRWGFAMASEDYRDVLDAGVDIVIVASPSALHVEHARAALLAGAHVLVEKPFAVTGRDAWSLVDLAARLDRHLVVSFGYNYRPIFTAAEELLSEPGIGELESLMISMSSVTRDLLMNRGAYPRAAPEAQPDAATWTDPALSGGGYGQAQLSHALGVALQLTGIRAREVFSFMRTPPVELADAIAVRYDNGAVGTVAGTSAHLGFEGNRDQLHIRMVGDRGHLDLAFEQDSVRLFRPGGSALSPRLPARAGAYECDGPPNLLVDLAQGRDRVNRSPGELGARTTELLEAAYRSTATGMPVTVGRTAE